MNLREIAIAWLKEHGFEGLGREGCGCEVDDLMPCDEPGPDCQPGVKVPCPGPDECDECAAYGDCAFHIGKKLKIENHKS